MSNIPLTHNSTNVEHYNEDDEKQQQKQTNEKQTNKNKHTLQKQANPQKSTNKTNHRDMDKTEQTKT